MPNLFKDVEEMSHLRLSDSFVACLSQPSYWQRHTGISLYTPWRPHWSQWDYSQCLQLGSCIWVLQEWELDFFSWYTEVFLTRCSPRTCIVWSSTSALFMSPFTFNLMKKATEDAMASFTPGTKPPFFFFFLIGKAEFNLIKQFLSYP